MPDWLQIILIIVIILTILIVVAYSGWKYYKRITQAGSCTFIATTPVNTTSGLIQVGYISCGGGGRFWQPEQLTIANIGTGTFYLYVPQGLIKLDPSDSKTITVGSNGILPAILSDTASTPTFAITVI
jgi:hypothetical protein